MFMKDPGRGHSESRMGPFGPGYPRKRAKPHSSGKIQPVLQCFKTTAEKDPAFALSLVCLLCTCKAAAIPRGFRYEVQWLWMLSTLKIEPFLP